VKIDLRVVFLNNLFSIITLNCTDVNMKMSTNKIMKIGKDGVNIRFERNWISPHQVGKIINKN
jgi:hypothetical protein